VTVETLRIERLVAGGDGLAREPGKPVTFVPGTAPGDLVRAEVSGQGQLRRGVVLEILEPGPGRRDAPCAEAGSCGGCPWMILTEAAQAEAAQDILESALRRGGAAVADGAVRPALSLGEGGGRRQRMRLHLDLDARGSHRAGFLRPRTHDIHPAAACLALEPALETLRLAVTQALPSLSRALGAGRAELAIDLPRDDAAAALLRCERGIPRDALLAALRELQRIAPLEALAAESGPTRVTLGSDAVGFRRGPVEDPLRWPAFVAPGGFLQASRDGNALLVSRVLALAHDAGLRPGARVLELFAGSGNLTLPLAGAGFAVEASDADAAAVAWGRRAIAACEPALWPTPQMIARDAARHAREVAGADERFDAVVLDPPRTGARDVAALLPDVTDLVLWVSCDAPTFARDAALMSKSGFVVQQAQPLLLFPGTAHFESVAVLRRAP
jgi:23S rRNA (uracil1939-C5)-methyltransferase